MSGVRRPRRDPWVRDCHVSSSFVAIALEHWRHWALRGMTRRDFRALLAGSLKTDFGFDDAAARAVAQKALVHWANGRGSVNEATRAASRAALAEPRRSKVVASISTPATRAAPSPRATIVASAA